MRAWQIRGIQVNREYQYDNAGRHDPEAECVTAIGMHWVGTTEGIRQVYGYRSWIKGCRNTKFVC